MLFHNKYIDLSLKGEKASAESLFDKTVVSLIKLDKICDLSRVYITRYIIDLPKKNFKTLNIANEYALSDNCKSEENIINFLLGKDFDLQSLEMPFYAYAKYSSNKDINILISASQKENIPDYTKSRLLKYASKEILNKDIKQAQKLIKQSKDIDTFNGWTYSIYQDLLIMREICLKTTTDCKSIDKRIELIKKVLLNK
jgi:hypothetical protein